MASLNKVMLIGNLTRDPEIRYTPRGAAVCDIGLAINRVWTTDDGEKKEDVTFVDVTLWGRTAENVGKYMTKGSPLYVEGRLQLDSWVDKDTQKNRTKLKVVGDMVQFLGSRGGGQAGASGTTSSGGAATPATVTDDDDDIPF